MQQNVQGQMTHQLYLNNILAVNQGQAAWSNIWRSAQTMRPNTSSSAHDLVLVQVESWIPINNAFFRILYLISICIHEVTDTCLRWEGKDKPQADHSVMSSSGVWQPSMERIWVKPTII